VLESLRPLTLVLGAVAAWLLVVLGLTLVPSAGLGGRYAVAQADGAARPLPKLNLTPGKSRLGPLADYAQIGARPLLMPGRKPQPIAAAPGEAGESDLNAKLTSVLITPALQVAILTLDEGGLSRRVRVGENVEGTNWHLTSLEPRRAVFDGPTGQKVLDLRVFDGQGGLVPTQIARASGGDGGDGRDGSDPRTVNTPLGPLPANGAPPGSPIAAARPSPAPPGQNPTQPTPAPSEQPMSQQEQVEAIRRRIEARRAQMRAQPPAGDSNQVK
jgi:general secretion pathway protein N